MGLLDDPPFSLSHQDAARLVERLVAVLGAKASALTVAKASGLREADSDWDGRMADVWPRVLEEAARRGRLRRLVEQALAAVPAEALFEELLGQTSTVPARTALSPGELWSTPRLWRTAAMIDRTELREAVQDMLDPDGSRALFVVGPSGSGKSHTWRFICYLAQKGQLPQARIIDNSRRAGPPMTVQELAQRVASTLAGEQAPTFDLVAQQESVVNQFRGWLSGFSGALTDPVWLVFDGFTSESATATALQLIHDLAVSVAEYQLGQLRVAVCGFDGPTPGYLGALCEPLRHPTDADVKAFFARMSKLLKTVQSDDAAIDLVFSAFVGRDGPIEGRPLSELGPSALGYALEVYGGATR